MKTKIVTLTMLILALGVFLAAGEQPKPAAGPVTGKLEIEKCSNCGAQIQLRIHPDDSATVLCPACGKEMGVSAETGVRITFQCAACGTKLELKRTTENKVVVECPKCGVDMPLRCPQCTEGVMRMAKIGGDKATLKCSNCHKEVDVAR